MTERQSLALYSGGMMKPAYPFLAARHTLALLGVAALGVSAASSAAASESVTFTYDALGRLVRTQTTTGPAAGMDQATAFDPAGNRTNHTVTGAPPNVTVIVLPLNGFTILAIPR